MVKKDEILKSWDECRDVLSNFNALATFYRAGVYRAELDVIAKMMEKIKTAIDLEGKGTVDVSDTRLHTRAEEIQTSEGLDYATAIRIAVAEMH